MSKRNIAMLVLLLYYLFFKLTFLMKNLSLIILIFFAVDLLAHDINYSKIILKQWNLDTEKKTISGSFTMFKNGEVYIEDVNSKILHFPLSHFSKADQDFVLQKYNQIRELNNNHVAAQSGTGINGRYLNFAFFFSILILIIVGFYLFSISRKKEFKYLLPVFLVGIFTIFSAFTSKIHGALGTITDPLFVDAAFAPFKPDVYTHWDDNYFYVESIGIPDHDMMKGITAWQQQVPIPQCYVGNNPWSIPLNPEIAATPVPVNPQHFLKGAVAIAVNGIAIFNPYTNTGVDALLDGQLDNWGGHCGRADDYHYHIAPMILYNKIKPNNPVAFALDGFAVYGNLEPDSTAMLPLDVYHGHYGLDGVYHYHATPTAPYMIGNMVGKVTEDADLQIIPQAKSNPIRPAQTPLKGATITNCQPKITKDGYILDYTKDGANYSVDYGWTQAGVYNFKFISPTGTTTASYNGFKPCKVTATSTDEILLGENDIQLYPNPANGEFSLLLSPEISEMDIRGVEIYNIAGELIYNSNSYERNLKISGLSKGMFLVKIRFEKAQITKKLLVQ